jgi:DNA recombination protein RmuC
MIQGIKVNSSWKFKTLEIINNGILFHVLHDFILSFVCKYIQVVVMKSVIIKDRNYTMDIINIILISITLIVLFVLFILLFVVLRQQNKTNSSLTIQDLKNMNEQIDRSIKQANQAVNDVLMMMQRQVGQSQTDSFQGQTQLRLELTKQLETLTLTNENKLESIRQTTTSMLEKLQKDNADKLEKMRETVDEKLNKTLEERLTQKFQLISSQFETVQKGFGEMQGLVSGVDELKRALSNVKTRGIMGEIQLGRILEEILSPDMYLKEVPTRPGSNERVEYAIRLPGDGNHPLFLPIDSKFPLEDYYTVLSAYDTNDMKQVDAALKVLETKIERFADDIASKYIEVPYTTNFAVLFLPVEGLFAEAIRRGLVEKLQTKYNVVLAGPTTMAALLNSLQIGFKTLAIQKKSQEVWHVLANARSEFDKFADVLAKAQEKIQSAGSELDRLIGTRTRMIQSKLKNLESLGENLKIEEQKVDSED